jgi:hypothetical protein
MGLRPRTPFVHKVKARRCPKCGCKLNSQRKRCTRCHAPTPQVKKKKKK